MKPISKDSLGNRMKTYEKAFSQNLPNRLPVIIRIDGRAFHTYTKGLDKPFDTALSVAMWETARKLCEQIPGAKMGYTQSDEITIVVTNDDKLETQPWFDNNIQKLVSISASIATFEFNLMMLDYTSKPAHFDSRAFIVPDAWEVANCLHWRQADAIRNSVQMFAQANFPQQELQGLNVNELKHKLRAEKGINWEEQDQWKKVGTAIVRDKDGFWMVDSNTPQFKGNWDYIFKQLETCDINV